MNFELSLNEEIQIYINSGLTPTELFVLRLLFLDSDLRLTPNYLEDLVAEFEGELLGIGITQMTPMSEKHKDKFLHDMANWFMIAAENIKPHGAGCYGIVSKRYLHEIAGGFDEIS